MLLTVVAVLLVATIAVSAVLLVHAIRQDRRETRAAMHQAIGELAWHTQDILTPESVARALQIDTLEADRLLREMVDDVHVRMAVDDKEAVVKFWFTQLRSEPEDDSSRPVGKSDAQRPQRRRTTSKNPRITQEPKRES